MLKVQSIYLGAILLIIPFFEDVYSTFWDLVRHFKAIYWPRKFSIKMRINNKITIIQSFFLKK